ncbi:hypothetical protein VTO42DRAFT_1974 [Malbranchea cinnamomea]
MEVESRQPELLRMLIIFPAISIGLVAIRLYSRYLARRFGWDDFFIILALIIAVAACPVTYIYSITNWEGHHFYDIPLYVPEYQSVAALWSLLVQILYNPIIALVRQSIISLILSLYHVRRWIRLHLYVISVLNVGLFFAVLFSILFQCHPFHYTFDFIQMDRAAREAAGAGPDGRLDGKLVTGGHCINQPALYISTALVSITLDIWLLVIPSAMVWGVNMPRRQKAVVVIVLSAWFVATIMGIVRLSSVAAAVWLRPNYRDVKKSTYNVFFSFHWIESNVSIWAASLPAYKYLLSRYFPRLWTITPFELGYRPRSSDQLCQPQRQPLGPELSTRPSARDIPSSNRWISPSEIELTRFEHDPIRTRLDPMLYHDTWSHSSNQG